MNHRVLYLVTCRAPLAARIGDGVKAARERGWSPAVLPTDASLAWVVVDDLGDVPVVTGQRGPDEAKRLPPADAVAVVPTTFNTLNAWANGTANTYPLATLCAALGARLPTVAVPFAQYDFGRTPGLARLARRPALRRCPPCRPSDRQGGHAEPVASPAKAADRLQGRPTMPRSALDRADVRMVRGVHGVGPKVVPPTTV